jgi:hypothetical protein
LIACLNRLSNVVQFVKCLDGSRSARSSELTSCVRNCTAPPADTRRASTVAPHGAPADKVLARSI